MSGRRQLGTEHLGLILAGYGLGTLRRCVYVERGYVNEKWLLETDNGLYLLKRRHASLRKRSVVRAQHALIGHLRSKGFPSPALIPTRSGNTLLEQEGEVYEIQEYVSGAPYEAVNRAQLVASARTLAFYHNAVWGFEQRSLRWPAERYGASSLVRIVRALLESWGPAVGSELVQLVAELEGHVRDLESRYAAFGPLPELVIHGDYHGDNLVFQGDCIVAVLDYDLAHWCSRSMEVAEAIIAFCTDSEQGLKHIVYAGALDLELVRSFLAAYQAAGPLSQAEVHALPDMIRTIWLCASLDPPLEPLLSFEAAPRAMPEILALADWAVVNRSELLRACLAG
jgi:homoserine kinase type II